MALRALVTWDRRPIAPLASPTPAESVPVAASGALRRARPCSTCPHVARECDAWPRVPRARPRARAAPAPITPHGQFPSQPSNGQECAELPLRPTNPVRRRSGQPLPSSAMESFGRAAAKHRGPSPRTGADTEGNQAASGESHIPERKGVRPLPHFRRFAAASGKGPRELHSLVPSAATATKRPRPHPCACADRRTLPHPAYGAPVLGRPASPTASPPRRGGTPPGRWPRPPGSRSSTSRPPDNLRSPTGASSGTPARTPSHRYPREDPLRPAD